jgi:hypothetical protein
MYQVLTAVIAWNCTFPRPADIIAISNPLTDAQIVGRVEAATAKKLTITSEYGTFEIIS